MSSLQQIQRTVLFLRRTGDPHLYFQRKIRLPNGDLYQENIRLNRIRDHENEPGWCCQVHWRGEWMSGLEGGSRERDLFYRDQWKTNEMLKHEKEKSKWNGRVRHTGASSCEFLYCFMISSSALMLGTSRDGERKFPTPPRQVEKTLLRHWYASWSAKYLPP